MSHGRGICMEKPLDRAWVGQKIGWGRVSENHFGEANSVSQVDGNLEMMPVWACRGWGGGSSAKVNGFC